MKQLRSFSKNEDCNCSKDFTLPCNKKSRTTGVLLSVYNCGIIASYKEIYKSESIQQVVSFLLDTIQNMSLSPKTIVYDNGCHLKQFIEDKNNKHFKIKTDRLNNLKSKLIVVDRFHFAKHSKKNKFCVEFCDPDKHIDLEEVNTSIAESTNKWFSCYKYSCKHMNRDRYKFFIYIICNDYNKSLLDH